MSRRLLFTLLAFLLLACSNLSQAGYQNEKTKKVPPEMARLLEGSADDFIKRFDKNGDGYLTKDELPSRLAAVFDRVDANGDGKLDKKEVAALMQILRNRLGLAANAPGKNKPADQTAVNRMVENFLQRMDTNKDGKISKDEAKGPLANNFERFDVNRDGYLDRKELQRVAEQFVVAQRANAGKAGKKGGLQDGPQARRNLVDFDSLDRNADGRLTREELKGTPYEAVFDQIDTNKDGKIDKKEFEAYLQKQAEKNKDS